MARKPASRRRAKPGSRTTGRFFHIEVRPSREFVHFRLHDVGKPGGIQRLAGQRLDGSWDTQKWLIEKTDAHIEDDRLVPDTAEARKVLASLGSTPVHGAGNRFNAKPHRNTPKAKKRTSGPRRAHENIRKTRAALKRRKRTRTRKAGAVR